MYAVIVELVPPLSSETIPDMLYCSEVLIVGAYRLHKRLQRLREFFSAILSEFQHHNALEGPLEHEHVAFGALYLLHDNG